MKTKVINFRRSNSSRFSDYCNRFPTLEKLNERICRNDRRAQAVDKDSTMSSSAAIAFRSHSARVSKFAESKDAAGMMGVHGRRGEEEEVRLST